MVKKLKKDIYNIGTTSLMGGTLGLSLGAIGGSSAVHGQQGISSATSMLSTTGTISGASATINTLNKGFKTSGKSIRARHGKHKGYSKKSNWRK